MGGKCLTYIGTEGVAIGIVTLLRTRHESYPYQVQSYQAYTLAHAGVEFALGYAKENVDNFFQNPVSYIPPDGKEFRFGNGKFTLRYIPGFPDTLYSRGECGTATREVRLTEFGSFVGQSRLYAMPATLTNITPVGSPPYTYVSSHQNTLIESHLHPHTRREGLQLSIPL